MKTKSGLWRGFYKDFIGSENRFLFLVWSAALILILGFGFILNTTTVSILGVAESREYQVNFDTSVEIKHVYVIPSQTVKKGDLLVELNQSELTLQLRTLKGRYDKLIAEQRLRDQISRITNDTQGLSRGADPLMVDIADTKREMDLIESRMKNLFVFAEVDGTVGAVNFKNGEKAPAFAPLITLLPVNPSYVNAFMNENLPTPLIVGQSVQVSSTSGQTVQGVITQVGARIVPIPERLFRNPNLTAWGREVMIKIPPRNSFLLGEKVSIHKSWGISFMSQAQADAKTIAWGEAPQEAVQELKIPSVIIEEFEPELSGMAYLPEMKQFVVVSDDYPEDRPFFMLMNEQGELQDRPLYIENLDKMEDIESVSRVDDHLYLLSSLSPTKKGKLKSERQMFVKVKRNALRFVLEGQVDLRENLLKAIQHSTDPVLQSLARQSADLEVEGHFIDNGLLFVALKGPILDQKELLILQIADFDKVFAGEDLKASDVSVFRHLKLPWSDPHAELLVTDLISENKTIFFSTSCRSSPCSALWRLQPNADKAELMHEFPLRHLEGLGVLSHAGKIFGVFDSKRSPRYFSLPLPLNKGTL
jgi:hypothetical protein